MANTEVLQLPLGRFVAEKSKTLFPKPIPCRTEVRFRVFRGETNLTEFVRTRQWRSEARIMGLAV